MEKKVAMVILTHNQKKMLEEAINSIFKKTNYKNYKLFIMDNGSSDRHDLMVKKKFPKVDIIRSEKNLGYSKGNNLAIKKACKTYEPDYFILLNDDIEIIDKNWLKKMIKVAESDDKIGIVGSQSIYPDGKPQGAGGYLKKWYLSQIVEFKEGEILDVDHLDIVCVLVKKELMDKLKGFDEVFTPFLLEDTDFCLRAKKEGYSIKLNTGVKVIHKKSKTLKAMHNKKRLLIRFKNDIIFSRRHFKRGYKFLRIFIYLPMVAIMKKKQDIDTLNLKNFKLRKDALQNLYYWFLAFFPNSYKKIIENFN